MNETSSKTSWLNLDIDTTSAQVDDAEAVLFELGAASITLLDAADHPLHEPDPGQTPIWPRVTLRALFAPDCRPDAITAALSEAGVIPSASRLHFNELADQDWERAWMDRFQPMHFGHGLWICPSHMTPEPDWPHVIRLDPGLAFGSGTHPTTALCLEWLAAHGAGLSPVLDFGCGSGILAIAAARLGARNIIAVDHDPQALGATEDNARRNDVAEHICACTPAQFDGDHAPVAGYPLIMANILAQPLIELAPRLSSLVAAGGVLVLSGILEQQADSVAEAYRKFDPAPECETREDWVRLVIRPH